MAKGKKGVVIYCDIIHTVNLLPDETAGKLFKHFLSYINDKNPETDDVMVKLAFEGMKQSLKRDLVKYEARAERSRKNGTLGGRPKAETQENPEEPNGLVQVAKEPKEPDRVKDSVSVRDSDIVKVKDIKEKNKEAPPKKKEVVYFEIKEINDSFVEFLKMRKEIKKKPTDHAIKLLIGKLLKMSNSDNGLIEIINQSTENSWASFYPLKTANNGNQSTIYKPKLTPTEAHEALFNDLAAIPKDELIASLRRKKTS